MYHFAFLLILLFKKTNCKVRPGLIYLLGQVRWVTCETLEVVLEVLNTFPIKGI